ncbi:mechanosensitive ion channel family protein [Lactobacillus hominis]|uniref:Toxin secretion/phage lysis holin n=1 Tax=Lactobacillus hominis DSM 23910 = CRBIP 24.179 TaxID=1423758 RepID=I7L927_9LACO|nr:mechanosensitive ion channel family protein [Lactobacillus hominis]KRM85474.1 small-conductance mechanosensitive channel [Lactobacillus hominis DSM 23910 = CRBIP 24.179]MCT3347449.1 mechanosensitive ion channel family protein [Lactobacillus hominis]CCI81109.1 Toxin secretion/phage lysis holin [Lactobacillus hominis DSM 23910 = CRBIP 24.179]
MNISSLLSKSINKSSTTPLIDWGDVAHNLLGKTIHLIITTLIFFIIWRIGKRLINKYVINNKLLQTKASGRTRTLSELSINIFQYTLLFFYLYGALSILGLPVGTLLASAGIVSLALGMGAQGFVSDVVNGINLLSEAQFDVGDTVKIGNYTGTVVQLGLRTTRLKSNDGTITYIPNHNISVVENITRGGVGLDIVLQINSTSDLKVVKQSIESANHILKPKFMTQIKKGPTIIGVTTQNGSTLTYEVHFQVMPGSEANVRNAYFSHYIEALKNNNIKFS